MEEKKQEEIKVTDRRQFYADGTPRPDASAGEKAEAPPPSSENEAQPETGSEPSPQPETQRTPTFLGFLVGLVNGAASYLGLVPHPESGRAVVDLLAAKQMIDILSLLQEKTRGNLTSEEEEFLQNSLTELRLVYVKEVESASK